MPSHPHDDFLRLCALSTAGELTSEEETELGEHLLHCDICKEALIEYEHVVGRLLPTIAAESASEMQENSVLNDWSIDEAEKALFRAIEQHPENSLEPDIFNSHPQRRNRLVAFAAIFAVGASICGAAYYAHHQIKKETTQSKGIRPAVPANSYPEEPLGSPVGLPTQESTTNTLSLELADLRRKLLREESRNAVLQKQVDQTEAQMKQTAIALEDAVRDRNQLQLQAALDSTEKNTLQGKLAALESAAPASSDRVKPLEAQVTVLNALVEEKDKTIAQDAELLQHDREIRNLMGARNLYIAEIYDVSKTGNTQKPFGRVFYTRDKSLIFYGFDLDQQRHVKSTSVFQAWGRKDAEHDVSLGILYQDDASHDRWVLKFNDAATLAHLDAVFVTMEPSGGSSKPSSKPLLFTYLRLPANHP